MVEGDGKGIGLEIAGGRVHFRVRGTTAPRSVPYAECTGVSLRMAPVTTGLGMNSRYRVELLGRDLEPAILIGESDNLIEARDAWRRAAGKLELPAIETTPDGAMEDTDAGPPPANISRADEAGHVRVTLRRGKLEFIFISALAVGLGLVLALGERSADNLFFMVLAAGLLGYAVIGGLSTRFINIADGRLTVGLRTPLGDFAKVDMSLAEIETVLWGRAENRPGRNRAAAVIATDIEIKSFARLTDDQARWLTRFVRGAVRDAE